MKNTLKTIALGAALLGFSTSPALAHRAWILPSTFVLSGESPWVAFDAVISNDLFYANHHAMGYESITVTSPGGEEVEKQFGNDGHIRSSFEIQLDEKGTYLINRSRSGYFASWEENGERQRWRGDFAEFQSEGLAGKEGIELTESVSRTATYVTNGAPDRTALKPENKGLELTFPDIHPNDLFTGEEVSFTFLMDGEPVEGVEVSIHRGAERFRDTNEPIEVTTDSEGGIAVNFEEPGQYWLTASTRSEAGEKEGVPVSKRSSYSATLEVLPL